MGSLANLYISQSYTSLIHLGSDTTASANFAELQDGLGNGLGISVNTEGDISASHSVKTLDLFVMRDTELSGAFNLNTYITASTIPYFNSTQPFFNDTVYVTGSYAANTYPPSIADVEVGWLCNGINVTNGVVTAVSKSVSGYYITVGGEFPQASQYYTFTGRTSPTAHIYGALEISENLVVSGTFDIEGKVVVNDDVVVNGTLSVSSSTSITGALDVRETLTASAALIENDLIVSGTLFANKVVTLIESSSIIYSSGSNILGDEVSDTQTLIGATIMSGSAALSGSMDITNNLFVTNNISSSTISGIGNVTLYSQSVDSRLDLVEATASYLNTTFSTSVDLRLDEVEATSSYLYTTFSTSVDSRLDYLETTFSTSVDLRLDEVEATASYLNTTFSTSVDSRLDVVEATASLYIPFSTSVDSRLDSLQSFTGSYATTGSNTFIGNEIFSGSVRGIVNQLSITSNTASMDCSTSNFFTINLPTGSTILIAPTNIQPGETISLRINQATSGTASSVAFPSYVKFPTLSPYVVSSALSTTDILTFISFDTSSLFAAAVKNLT